MSALDNASPEVVEQYNTLVEKCGENNVWHYKDLYDDFDVNKAWFSAGLMLDVRRKSDGAVGSLDFGRMSEDGPRFYFNFVAKK